MLSLTLLVVLFSVLFGNVITSLVEERAGLYASRALNVYLACVTFLSFTLPLGVLSRLWVVIVALPGLFI